MSRTRIATLVIAAMLVATLAPVGMAQPAPAQSLGDSPASLQPSIAVLKTEYLQCDRISSQRRLSMHGMTYCNAVSNQLLKREFGGDLELMLGWWRAERQVTAVIGR